jgi:ribosomal protein S18 acetylase RimI-like enzyme
VGALQARPEHRIGYFGDTDTEIAALLASWATPWPTTARIAERDGTLVGFAAADLDEATGRAWVHGPLVDDPEWESVADALLREVVDAAPPGIDDFELVGDVANVRLAALADRHAFTAGEVHHLLTLDRAGIRSLPTLEAAPLARELEDDLVALHDSLFPATYYPGRTLLERAARHESEIVIVAEAGSLVAYGAGQIDEVGAGYVDYVGVPPQQRRRGRGRTAVVALIRALRARRDIPYARLVVAGSNVGALALYDSLGFTRTSSMVGYRRRPEVAA